MKLIFLTLLSVILCGCASNSSVRTVKRYESEISKDGLTVSTLRVRAWVEDIERDVAAATLVSRVADGQSIGGLTLDSSNERVVYSVIEELLGDEKTAAAKVTGDFVSTLRGIPVNGGGVSQITTGRWLDTFPNYGPEGYITFASNRIRPDGFDIFRVSSVRSGGVSVIRQTVDGFNFMPSVHRDGKMIYSHIPDYRRRGFDLSNTAPQLWSLGGGNPYPTQLREGWAPSISPDGLTIAYIGENGQLWTIGSDGTNPIQITSTPIPRVGGIKLEKTTPSWSPDGEYILYAAADGKDGDDISNYDIWMVHREGGNSRQLTTNGSLDIYPVVSPQSNEIYFVSNRGFIEGVWKIPYPNLKSDI